METHQDSLPKLAKNSFADSYSDDRPAGRTIGTRSPSGVQRKGVDKEGAIAIDNGALRFHPLIKPGWERQGIAYGPYTRQNGLAFSVFLLNGHNTSQAGDLGESLVRRLLRWAVGPQKKNPVRRLLRWIPSHKNERPIRRFWRWIRNSKTFYHNINIDENLAVGWFPREVPANPLTEGNAFVVHATGPENGELRARVGTQLLSAFKGLQNLQVYYVIILRKQGAAYYAAAVPNAHGLGAYPNMRPIAIDPFNADSTVYAAVYQSVLGQIGFSVDTRVYGVRVEAIPTLANWYGTAHAADSLTGNSSLASSAAEVGGIWQLYAGGYERTKNGVKPTGTSNLAVLDAIAPSGLIHAMLDMPATVTSFGLLWRVRDERNYWTLQITGNKCEVLFREDDTWQSIAISEDVSIRSNSVNSIQILDDGETFSFYLNGQLLFNTWFTDSRLQNATGIGLSATDANEELCVRALEAHPRSLPIPTTLDLGTPWIAEGKQTVVTDNFAGAARDLAGKNTSTGNQVWRKEIGIGAIELTGNGSAKVKANAQHPNPGRTAYTIAWNNSNFADIQVEITPPGTKRGQGEKGRGGLIFWQDADHYITISTWLDDVYKGASISSFFYLKGFEDMYEAVWTNVGSRVCWGNPYQFRVVFDGMNYTAYVNDEPVLYRALTDVYPDIKKLSIHRVGLVANWEWGDDTGSIFKNFMAKL